MSRPAVAVDILRIWCERGRELYEFFAPFRPLHIFTPIDGRGARFKVSVLPGMADRMPRMFESNLDGEQVFIQLEVTEDYRRRERRPNQFGFAPIGPETKAMAGGHDLEDTE